MAGYHARMLPSRAMPSESISRTSPTLPGTYTIYGRALFVTTLPLRTVPCLFVRCGTCEMSVQGHISTATQRKGTHLLRSVTQLKWLHSAALPSQCSFTFTAQLCLHSAALPDGTARYAVELFGFIEVRSAVMYSILAVRSLHSTQTRTVAAPGR